MDIQFNLDGAAEIVLTDVVIALDDFRRAFGIGYRLDLWLFGLRVLVVLGHVMSSFYWRLARASGSANSESRSGCRLGDITAR